MSTATIAPAAGPALMTAEEFVKKHGGDYVELIDGIVEPIPMPKPLHGHVCFNAALLIGGPIREQKLGLVCTNDTFVLVGRDPDRVRGADVVYWSKAKLPDGEVPEGMIEAPPDLCVEVVSPTNGWTAIFTKVGDYLGAGVQVVLVLDPNTVTASVCRDPGGQQILAASETLTLPDILPGFAVPVHKFFE